MVGKWEVFKVIGVSAEVSFYTLGQKRDDTRPLSASNMKWCDLPKEYEDQESAQKAADWLNEVLEKEWEEASAPAEYYYAGKNGKCYEVSAKERPSLGDIVWIIQVYDPYTQEKNKYRGQIYGSREDAERELDKMAARFHWEKVPNK